MNFEKGNNNNNVTKIWISLSKTVIKAGQLIATLLRKVSRLM